MNFSSLKVNLGEVKKVPSAAVFFTPQTRNMIEIMHILIYFSKKSCMIGGERNLNIKPLKDISGFCFLCTLKLRAECYQPHV